MTITIFAVFIASVLAVFAAAYYIVESIRSEIKHSTLMVSMLLAGREVEVVDDADDDDLR